MAKKDSTKDKIIRSAFELFHRQGVRATGLEEILRASGTGKGQFYHYFKSKDDLVHHVLGTFFRDLKLGHIPLKHDLKGWHDLDGWFQFFIDAQKAMRCDRSCPVATIAAELSDDQSALRRDACEILDYSRSSLVRFFARMREKGEIAKSCNPESLADFCYSIMQGGMLIAKIRRNSAPFENAVNHALRYIRSLRL